MSPHYSLCGFHQLGQVLPVLCSADSIPNHCQKLREESSPFKLPQEEESLQGFLHQEGCACGESEIRCNVDSREFDVVHTL